MKKTIIISSAVVLAALSGAAFLGRPQSTDAADSPLITQVQQQQDELANHETRITNTENNVVDLQKTTNTAPSTKNVAVAPVAQPQTVATPPVTVIGFQQVAINSLTTDCLLTYSDGTTYQWHWKVINPQGAWEVDNLGARWVQTTQTTDKCDSTKLGQVKP